MLSPRFLMLSSSLRQRLLTRPATATATRRADLSTYSSSGGGGGGDRGWMESYPWGNFAAAFGFGYISTVMVERSIMKPKQASLKD